ncbi:SLC13 family permease [Marinococcus halophilus]|uniref:SLC13 family permease n=1 Tax=Marinococcus halophilus TaxID=1371 RepID=A0A510Y8V4_MARHA|nr:SLC13 family permease [Marinococcus halophilus]GEK59121.1 SLC13 family permease [Marinococcus halophilus]
MSWEIAWVLIIVLAMVGALMKEIARPSIIFLFVLSLLLVTGLITPQQGLKGFANQGMLTVGLLCIVAGAVQQTGIVDRFVEGVLSKGRTPRGSLMRMLVPSALMSGFLNNTPIVATFSPLVKRWCEKYDLAPSKFLLPLSYATIIGGTITLIGTSTNLVVHGLLLERGYAGFHFFQLALIGIPATIAVTIFILTVGIKILPARKPPLFYQKEGRRKYMLKLEITPAYKHLGETLKRAGFINDPSMQLLAVIPKDAPGSREVGEHHVLEPGDCLVVYGDLAQVAVLENIEGLNIKTEANEAQASEQPKERKLMEVMVTHYSNILFTKLKDIFFDQRFDAAIIGIHRYDESYSPEMKEMVVKPGDTLLLLAGPEFEQKTSAHNDFHVLKNSVNPFLKGPRWKSWLPLVMMVLMVVLAALQIIPIFYAALIAVAGLLVTGSLSLTDVHRYIPYEVLIVIAAAFGLGEAMMSTGAASLLAEQMIEWFMPFGVLGVFTALYVLTNIFTEVVTNNAAAIVMLPVALETVDILSVSPVAAAVIVAIAASASFITPIGYQTNLFVYTQGGYRFTDFMKIGVPVSLIVMTITISITWTVWG